MSVDEDLQAVLRQVERHGECNQDDHEIELHTWWLSFTRVAGPVGVMIVDAGTEAEALLVAGAHVRNKGITQLVPKYNGDIMVLCVPLKACKRCKDDIAYFGKDRLIPPTELEARGYEKVEESSLTKIEAMLTQPGNN